MNKYEIIRKHVAMYYRQEGRSVNMDDILPISRILPMIDEYATNKIIDELKILLAQEGSFMKKETVMVIKSKIVVLEKSIEDRSENKKIEVK